MLLLQLACAVAQALMHASPVYLHVAAEPALAVCMLILLHS
jgi:hypothetical protein